MTTTPSSYYFSTAPTMDDNSDAEEGEGTDTKEEAETEPMDEEEEEAMRQFLSAERRSEAIGQH